MRSTTILLSAVLLALLRTGCWLARRPTHRTVVQVLQVLYGSLNRPYQLSGWKSSGGDPCGESWKGISCSGSSVVSIQNPGLGLDGSLGYQLANLLSLRTLDLSDNYIHDAIPYQLPPNLTYLNLANNRLTGNVPYSISTMVFLNYLNASRNSLSEAIGDVFLKLQDLSVLDLSFNNLTGVLPNSFSSLLNLSSLYLQDNQLTGPVDVLSNLEIENLNIANNHFTGWIPREFSGIPNLRLAPCSSTTPLYIPPPDRSNSTHNRNRYPKISTIEPEGPTPNTKNNKSSMVGPIMGIVVGSAFVGLCATVAVFFCLWNYSKGKGAVNNNLKDSPAVVFGTDKATSKGIQEVSKVAASVTSLKPPITEKAVDDKQRMPITAMSYSVASLQLATNSFSQEYLVGEGSLGRVYKAEMANGKVLAVKRIDSAALSLQEEDNFLEAVSSMSRLRHANTVTLLGYCVEHGQRLLVHEYIGNGTLHDILHFTDDDRRPLTWNGRVKIATGVARALEYLHEVCLPSVAHRNLKSSNILLDDELNPYLSDCGLAALTSNTERQVSAQMIGSFGYSAPEFAMSGIYSIKSDVYSFGVVMLELLTGRKALDSSRVRSEQSLVRWSAPQLHDIDALARMVDPALRGMYPVKSVSRFADIIALCVQPEPEFRPPMSEVVQALIRLMQRASTIRRRSTDDLGFSYKIQEH
ncbi:unnamed protein product [Spirodela intermedia]|uniref:Protein kinase domain-containing protein n=1 Tax=Spirodela intermedia TaxID=51605 RepID=A0A7I8JKD5_SPIIN|nr:unnamed protein product [Spirodela intermedia]CAA6670589.1 unnamed protein product [Spirodela intermedia]